MIDFILDKVFAKRKHKINEIIKDLSRILELEGKSIQKIQTKTQLPDKYLEPFKPEIKQVLIELFATLSENDFKDHILLKKYFLNKKSKPQKKALFGDLFSGAGGIGLGLENAGFYPSFIADENYSALLTYYINREIPLENYFLGDIKDIQTSKSGYINRLKDTFLITGGPPCQGFSNANRQRLINDSRNELYKDFLHILEEIQPPFFLIENVRGMAKRKEEIQEDMTRILGKKYQYCFLFLNSRNYNIPQNRERFFIIGNRIGANPEDIAYSIKSQGKGTRFLLKDALEGLPKIRPSNKFNQASFESEDIGFKIVKTKIQETEFSSYINNGRKQEFIFNHKSRFNNLNDQEIFRRLPSGGNSLHESIQDILKYKNRSTIFKDKYFRLEPHKVCKAITSHMRFDCHMYIHPKQARGLSPREAARVQTFPDDYLFMGRPNEWYQQIGNAVPVKLAEILGKEIMKYY